MKEAGPGFQSALGPYGATMLVAGSMIGSGVFIVSADVARQVGAPGWLLVVWAIAGAMTAVAALAYAELAAMMPQAGGPYVFLQAAYGRLAGFLYGWTLFTVIQTGTIAAVAVAFAKFLGVLWPAVHDAPWLALGPLALSPQRAVAIALVAGLTAVNLGGVRLGAALQNAVTTAKLLALAGLVALGLLWAQAGSAWSQADWWTPLVGGQALLPGALAAAIGTAMVGALFSSDAWYNLTFAAGEVKEPQRTLPLGLGLGVALVTGLYLLANLAYLRLLPWEAIQAAPQDRVGVAAVAAALGPGGALGMAGLIMLSTFGCVNGIVLGGARVLYAMAQDGLFFRAAGRLNRQGVPGWALVAQGLWAAGLTLTGSYGQLLDYVITASVLFFMASVGAVFVLRRRQPEAPRPYRAWGHPWLPGAYLLAAAALVGDLLWQKPAYTWPGFLIVLLGLPAYALVRHRRPGEGAQGGPAS